MTAAGSLSDRAYSFVKQIVAEYAPPSLDHLSYCAAMQRAMRRLSVALQSGNALVLREGMAEARLHASVSASGGLGMWAVGREVDSELLESA